MDRNQLLKKIQTKLQEERSKKEKRALWLKLFKACRCHRTDFIDPEYFPIHDEEGEFTERDIRPYVEEYAFLNPVTGYEAVEQLLKGGYYLLEMRDGLLYIGQKPEAIEKHELVIIGAVRETDDYMAVPIFRTSKIFRRRIADYYFLHYTFDTNCRFLVFKDRTRTNP